MLDFHEVFWHADKCRKTAEKLGKTRGNMRKIVDSEIFLVVQGVADANLQTRTHCIADVDYLPTSSCYQVTLWLTEWLPRWRVFQLSVRLLVAPGRRCPN